MSYYCIALLGLIFVVLPTEFRANTLTACGLDPNQARNLIYLAFLVIKYQGHICQMFVACTVLKREPSTFRMLGMDRAPLKLLPINF